MSAEVETAENLSVEVTLDMLAIRINDSHRMCESSVRAGLEHAVKCGKAPLEAKAQIPYGQWLSWFETNCRILSSRQAQGYMRIARHLPALESNTKPVSHLGVKEALALLAEPQERPQSGQLDGPLPDTGHEIYGYLDDGRVIHLIAAADPEFCFYALLDADLEAMTFGKRCIRRRAVHSMLMPVEVGSHYDPADVLWDDQSPCETPKGIYFPGYTPERP